MAPCAAGIACAPDNVCATGTTTCPTLQGAGVCVVAGNQVDGTACGGGRTCTNGSCGAAATISRVFVYDAVATVNSVVPITAEVSVGAGSPSRELVWSVESGGSVSPERGTSTFFQAPSTPGRYRVWATSVADPSKKDYGYIVVRSAGTAYYGPVATPVGSSPWGLLVAGGYLWVNSSGANTVSRVQLDSGSITMTYPVGRGVKGDMAYMDSDVWVTNDTDNSLSRVPIYGGSSQTYYPSWRGSIPHGAVSCGGYLWVALWGSSTVARIYVSGGYPYVWNEINVGAQPRALACDASGNVWVASATTVAKISPYGGVAGTYGSFENPYGIAYEPMTDSVWVANYGGSTVVKLRASDGARLGTYSVGSAPFGVHAAGGTVWVTNSGSNTLMELRASDGMVLATLKTGARPRGVAQWNGEPWVADFDGNDVRRLY